MSLSLTATLFFKSSFSGAISAYQSSTSSSASDTAFAVRSYLALSPPQISQARSLLDSKSDVLDTNTSKALKVFTDVIEHVHDSEEDERDLGNQVSALGEILESVQELGNGDEEQIECVLATSQWLDQDPIGALETLKAGAGTQRNLGSLALSVHLLLLNNRYDLAQKEYEAARVWAEDSLLIQLIEAELGLVKGGRNAQQAYYVYDEFSSVPTSSEEGKGSRLATMKLGRGVGLLKRGEYSRSEETLREAKTLLEQDSEADTIGKSELIKEINANLAVLALHLNPASKLSNAGQEFLNQLSAPAPAHQLQVSLLEMDKRFDELVANRAVAADSS
ncbi:unnamed protein product [Sympodiomycopsis kandeliae]